MNKQDTEQFFNLNPMGFTKAPLRAEQSISLNASTENEVGAIKHCSIGDMTWQEEVLLWNPDHALAYGLPDGNPMGMSGHLGVVLLAANETGGTLAG